jgi:hypothetical protein
MAAEADRDRELSTLVVPAVGTVVLREDPWEPVRLIDGDGEPVAAVTTFLRELQASGRSVATLRSVVSCRLSEPARHRPAARR